MGAVVSVRKPWIFTIAGLLLLVGGGPRFISSTYTLWNWTILLGQIADRALRHQAIPRLLPFLVVNSWAIFTSFNVGALFYRPHYRELAKRLDYSMTRFHFMNTIGHFVIICCCALSPFFWYLHSVISPVQIPPVIVTLWFLALSVDTRIDACEWTSVVPLPIASLAFHILWALRVGGGLRLDSVYLKRPKHHWYVAWVTAAITHVCVGLVVAGNCYHSL